MDVKTAIRKGDAEALRRLLAQDFSRGNALIVWGKDDRIRTHPLHYIADVLFEGTLEWGKELPLADALIESGADVDFQVDAKGDTPLIGAVSGPKRCGFWRQALSGRCAASSERRRCIGRRFLVKTAWSPG